MSDEQNVNPPPSLYLVVAYRWGQENNHIYFVSVGPDRKQALADAENECNDRGGKYGVAVYEFPSRLDYLLIEYFPSMQEDEGAREPHHNHRKDYHESLGFFADQACRGQVYLPVEGQPEAGLKATTVEVPEFLKQERQRGLDRLSAWENAEAIHEQQRREKKR